LNFIDSCSGEGDIVIDLHTDQPGELQVKSPFVSKAEIADNNSKVGANGVKLAVTLYP
jgi:predicted deacylase